MKVTEILIMVSILAFCRGAPRKVPQKDNELLTNHEGFMAWFGMMNHSFLFPKEPKKEASKEKDKVAPTDAPVSGKGASGVDPHPHPNPYAHPTNREGQRHDHKQGSDAKTQKPSTPVLPNPPVPSNIRQRPEPAPQNIPSGPSNQLPQPSKGTNEHRPQTVGVSRQPIPIRFNQLHNAPNRRIPNGQNPGTQSYNHLYNQKPIRQSPARRNNRLRYPTLPNRPNRGNPYPLHQPQNHPYPHQSRNRPPFQGKPSRSQSQSGPSKQGPVKNKKVGKKPSAPSANNPTTHPNANPSKRKRPSPSKPQAKVPMPKPQPLPIRLRPHRRPHYRPYPTLYNPYIPYSRRPAYPPPLRNRQPGSAENGTDPRILMARCFSEGRAGRCVAAKHECRGEVVTKAKTYNCQSRSYKCCPFEEAKKIIHYRNLPLATAFPGFKCKHSDGRMGKCLQSFFTCSEGKEASARCSDSGDMICCTNFSN